MSVFDLLKSVCVVVAGGTPKLVLVLSTCRPATWATYEVTGMSPQSTTFPQKLKGFSAKGLEFD